MGADIQEGLKVSEVTKEDREAAKQHQQRYLTSGCSESVLLSDAFARHREASTEALRTALRRIESVEYINSLQGTANFERLQQIARAALENRDD